MKKGLFVIGFSLLLFSCVSTKIEKTWRDPDTTVDMSQVTKVLVVALLKEETNRRIAEDQMVTYMKGKGVASYSYGKVNTNTMNEQQIAAQLKQDGFDAAVTMRLVDVSKDVTYTPGSFSTYPVYYRTFGGYYVRSWQGYSTPDRYNTTKTYTVETNIYSLKQNKLVWSGITSTTDPNKVSKMMLEVADVLYKRMVKEGFVK